MKKRDNICTLTHVFADGRVMTNEQFMSKPFEVSRKNNSEFYEQAEMALNIDFVHTRNAKRNNEYVALRRVELEKEIARINGELEKL